MIISTSEAMEQLGHNISQKHKKILLYGDLAAGKTTFVRGFAQGLGVDSKKVSSPTYAYLNIYDNHIAHIDMYRLEKENDLIEKGLLDAIMEYEYVLIEWPQRTEQYVDPSWIKLEFLKDGNIRNIIYRS